MTPYVVTRRLIEQLPTSLALIIALAMIMPSVLLAILSFSADPFIRFPPHAWGDRQYATLFMSSAWRAPFIRSIVVACLASTVALFAGLSGALALHRSSLKVRNAIQVLGIGPLLVPGAAYAVALYVLFARVRLVGTPEAVIIAHAALAVPFVLLITGAASTRIPREVELAALSLGAGRLAVLRDVVLPFLVPAIAASWVFAFVTSLDETVVTVFLSGAGFLTLPVAIFNSVEEGVDPVITAIATLLTIMTACFLIVYTLLRRAR